MNNLFEFSASQNLRQHTIITFLILAGLTFFVLQGCTLKSTYNAKVSELEACKANDAATTKRLHELENKNDDLAQELKARKKAEAEKMEVYNELLSDLRLEIIGKLLTIEMMKSGVNVNLPHDVLFSRNSAELSNSGKEMLLKVGAELAEIPYQVIVGGFTDNVAVGAEVVDKYPTNWELAGARAARVVRLLEEAGVAKERLRAMSFAHNLPVASNATPEGRAQNRRIAILLRPVVPEE